MDVQVGYIVLTWIFIGIVSFPFILRTRAPYGRHNRMGWGIQISNKLGWVIMESISFLVMAGFYYYSGDRCSNYVTLLMILWLGHYFYRSFIYPFMTRTSQKKIPVVLVLSAIIFNVINSGLNGYYFTKLEYQTEYWNTFHLFGGGLLFVLGFTIHFWSDNKLIQLRSVSSTGYKIPYGGIFKYISCPNHFGEILQWAGFAIMAWNLAALSFAIWTIVNLVPRAMHHHQWYQSHFEEYPKERKAVIPFFI